MRERTTWNRERIAQASASRTAEDPRAMNQDHLSQQPAADKYETGGPSEFAEDVHPSADTWKAEYNGDEVDRDEIGLPDFRSDTFKNASEDEDDDEETLGKKADVCVKVARQMLGADVDEQLVEDQAYALMHLPDVQLVETATRLAKGKVPPEFLEQQKKNKGDDEGDDDKGQAKDQGDKDQGDKDQKKEASLQAAMKAVQAGDQQAFQAAIQDMVQAMMPEPQAQQQTQEQQAQQQQQQMQDQQAQQQMQDQQAQQQMFSAEQVQQMIQQAVQQQMGQGQQQQMQQQGQQDCQGCGGGVMSDDDMIDDMLQGEPQQGEDVDIQLEGIPMDIGEVEMGQGDEVLSQLFASNPEVQQAQQAQALQTGVPVQVQAAAVRTASTRTVGTHPTGGVSQIGGSASPQGGAPEVDKLSSLWRSDPDVSDVFRS